MSTDATRPAEAVNQRRGAAAMRQSAYDVLIIGGGAAGIAAASSILSREPDLRIGIVEPAEYHFYQPGWTLVGRGIFSAEQTRRRMSDVIPESVDWIRASAAAFEPEANLVELEDGSVARYRALIVAPGLKLDWAAVDGLEETLGRNGVTSNYRQDLAPYTWELVQGLNNGRALFTQPPMPIKCAGAPQKAMYLSCDYWLRCGRLKDIDVEFHNAGAVLFGVAAFVPALMQYVERYGIDLRLESRLIAVDGPSRTAIFARKTAEGPVEEVTERFDMLHICPPQVAPDFVRTSPLAGPSGWVDVDQFTLQHTRYPNVFSLGDVCSAPNAKTAAAVRKQVPVVAVNMLAFFEGKPLPAGYDGYGSCPLTVEKGKIVLAEFGYDGKLLPSFPSWLIDGTRPSGLAWLLKEKMLPSIYWQAMLKGHEWLARPRPIEDVRAEMTERPS